jgi:hypothetical protein
MESMSKKETRLQMLQVKAMTTCAISNTVIKWKEYDESQGTTRRPPSIESSGIHQEYPNLSNLINIELMEIRGLC